LKQNLLSDFVKLSITYDLYVIHVNEDMMHIIQYVMKIDQLYNNNN